MAERLSTRDDTFISSYADHILRYRFAEPYCRNMRVLDAGCGIGYGAAHLARSGALSVLGIDISQTALDEALDLFTLPSLSFKNHSVEQIDALSEPFDTIVNFENIEHIQNPLALVSGAAKQAKTFITSTPNGSISSFDDSGHLINEFHVKEFTVDEFNALLRPHFEKVELFGQWLTPSGRLRKTRAKQLADDLQEAYFNPVSRIGRVVKRAMGKRPQPAPSFYGEADSFDGDFVIHPIESGCYPWPPTVIIAVCSNH